MKNGVKILFLCLALLFSSFCYAKAIKLYDQPKADAKVVGSVDSSVGVVAIYTPKDSEWIKVGNPRNGDVGWIKLSDLGSGSTSEVTFTQKILSGTGKGQQTFQVIQFGPQNLTPEQTKAIQKQMEAQKMLQKNVQKMIDDAYKNSREWSQFPVIMPVVVLPQPVATPAVEKK